MPGEGSPLPIGFTHICRAIGSLTFISPGDRLNYLLTAIWGQVDADHPEDFPPWPPYRDRRLNHAPRHDHTLA
eukprot:13967948-Alexandrium_andersonii.AAC.1